MVGNKRYYETMINNFELYLQKKLSCCCLPCCKRGGFDMCK